MFPTEIVLVFGFAILIAFYGVWKWSTADDNSFQRFVDKANELSGEVSHLKLLLEQTRGEFKLEAEQNANFRSKLTELEKQMDNLCLSHSKLKQQVIPRVVDFRLSSPQPIAVQIVPPTPPPTTAKGAPKKLLNKVKKQLDGLSK